MGLLAIWATAILARNVLATRIKLVAQDWLRAARAKIADSLSGEQPVTRMSQRVLEFLAQYLGAQAGALYVADAHGGYTRTGALGIDSNAQLPLVIKPGEGLVGRAVAERKSSRIEGLPSDYLGSVSRIGSGLGS